MEDCFKDEMERNPSTTTTSTSTTSLPAITTPTTTTSTTSTSTTTTTTSTSTTTTTTIFKTTISTTASTATISPIGLNKTTIMSNSTNKSNLTDIESVDYLDIANSILEAGKKTFTELYIKSSHFEQFYFLIALSHLIITILHSLFLFPVLKHVFFHLVNLLVHAVRFILSKLCCCFTRCIARSSSRLLNKSYTRLNTESGSMGNQIPLLSLDSPLNGNQLQSSTAKDLLSCRQLLRSVSFWLIVGLFFIYGGLLFNFLIFMPSYLDERITVEHSNQKNQTVYLFLFSLVVGRVLLISFGSHLG